MLGEPVRRGPILSITTLAVSMTLELRKPSWRICVTTSRSTRSSAGRAGGSARDARRAKEAAFLNRTSCLAPRTLPRGATVGREITLFPGRRTETGNITRPGASFRQKQGQGEPGLGFDPLLEGPEPGRGSHRRDLLGGVLVGTLRPDELFGREAHGRFGTGDRDLLRAAGDEPHLDAPVLGAPDRAVLERGQIEVREELRVHPGEEIPVE